MHENTARYLFDTSSEKCNSFRRNGYLVLSGIVEHSLIDSVRGEIEELLIAPSEAHRPKDEGFNYKTGRFQDAWSVCPSVSALASHSGVQDALRELYGREPHPFQTLTFSVGTQQLSHSDHIHFSSRPLGFMCGVWVALEDVTLENGPLFYFPGSHNLPYMGYAELGITNSAFESEEIRYGRYEHQIEALAQAHGFQREVFLAKKGDVLIWAANLIHGGSPLIDTNSSRWSQVTHYLFEDCLHYTPRFSDEVNGKFYVRHPIDLSTGTPIPSAQIPLIENRNGSQETQMRNQAGLETTEIEIVQLRTRIFALEHELQAINNTRAIRYTKRAYVLINLLKSLFRKK